MLVFIEYPPCSTCKKAKKFLDHKGLAFKSRHIVQDTPTIDELNKWVEAHSLNVDKLFNTSGKVYRELGLKDKLKTMSLYEKLSLLASNGMLIKRPLLVGDDFVLVGFKEAAWEASLS